MVENSGTSTAASSWTQAANDHPLSVSDLRSASVFNLSLPVRKIAAAPFGPFVVTLIVPLAIKGLPPAKFETAEFVAFHEAKSSSTKRLVPTNKLEFVKAPNPSVKFSPSQACWSLKRFIV